MAETNESYINKAKPFFFTAISGDLFLHQHIYFVF